MITKRTPFPIQFKKCECCGKERAISTFKNGFCIKCRESGRDYEFLRGSSILDSKGGE